MQKKMTGMADMKKVVSVELEKSRKAAEKELAKIKKHLDGTLKTVDEYVKKNPEKAAVVAAGIGAALGAAVALLVSRKKK